MQITDVNCDMGESSALRTYNIQNDIDLFPFVSSVNIACCFHAGDTDTIDMLVERALEAGLAVGAHPSFDDRKNFGRTEVHLAPRNIYALMLFQMGAISAFMHARETKLHHVKPHGSLYNMASVNRAIADAICSAIKDFDPSLIVYGLSGSELIRAAKSAGLASCSEVFADRNYEDDGTLTPRTEKYALIEDPAQSAARVLEMINHGRIKTASGNWIDIVAGTVCIHSDGHNALDLAKTLSETLVFNGIKLQSPAQNK